MPTRTILALATGSLVLGLVGVGAAVADEGPREIIVGEVPPYAQPGGYPYERYAYGKVVSRGPLKVRSRPTTESRAIGHVQPNSRVEIECKKYGEKVDGNRIWYRLHVEREDWENGSGREDRQDRQDRQDPDRAKAYEKEHWVSARYVKNLSEVRYCR
ncbi:SH3 domain-containing protein [Streptomyces sp. PCS3-D2]|uniref:SH3 domain-containing protein n=1 Tax=Streptomyces sp. PCS3-D2 TaxID=1460244 RepID=UPI0012FEE8BF|nr:SH3 domain-containing protein [Streptomyces sp. PCS3-D2]WKV70355.1 SH3 domain-containing protein [Streptomyces sp. PCS3-D2]